MQMQQVFIEIVNGRWRDLPCLRLLMPAATSSTVLFSRFQQLQLTTLCLLVRVETLSKVWSLEQHSPSGLTFARKFLTNQFKFKFPSSALS